MQYNNFPSVSTFVLLLFLLFDNAFLHFCFFFCFSAREISHSAIYLACNLPALVRQFHFSCTFLAFQPHIHMCKTSYRFSLKHHVRTLLVYIADIWQKWKPYNKYILNQFCKNCLYEHFGLHKYIFVLHPRPISIKVVCSHFCIVFATTKKAMCGSSCGFDGGSSASAIRTQIIDF